MCRQPTTAATLPVTGMCLGVYFPIVTCCGFCHCCSNAQPVEWAVEEAMEVDEGTEMELPTGEPMEIDVE